MLVVSTLRMLMMSPVSGTLIGAPIGEWANPFTHSLPDFPHLCVLSRFVSTNFLQMALVVSSPHTSSSNLLVASLHECHGIARAKLKLNRPHQMLKQTFNQTWTFQPLKGEVWASCGVTFITGAPVPTCVACLSSAP